MSPSLTASWQRRPCPITLWSSAMTTADQLWRNKQNLKTRYQFQKRGARWNHRRVRISRLKKDSWCGGGFTFHPLKRAWILTAALRFCSLADLRLSSASRFLFSINSRSFLRDSSALYFSCRTRSFCRSRWWSAFTTYGAHFQRMSDARTWQGPLSAPSCSKTASFAHASVSSHVRAG